MNGFHRISYKPHIFEREFKDTVKTVNQIVFTRTSIASVGTSPVKFYNCNGETYAYCSDKKVRKVEGSNFTFINFTSNVVPLIIAVTINGEKKIMIVSDETAIIDGNTVQGIPYGNSGAFCCGRLFIADGYKIKYSKEFDFTNFSVGLDFGGFIEVDKDMGEILYLAENNGKLFVFAEHAIFTLTPYGEPYEFKMEKISGFGLSIVKNTVFGAGNCIGFLSGTTFCVLSDGKIKFLSNTLASYGTITAGVAGGHKEFYVLPFSIGRNKYIFAYDLASGKEVAELITGYVIAGEYAAMIADVRFYRITMKSETVTDTEAYSGDYDFGSCARKSVCRIEAHIQGSAEIVITGDSVHRAAITEKCNSVSCYVHGRSFNINFENASEDFKLYKIAVHYINHGE